jgi:hypothetical protein
MMALLFLVNSLGQVSGPSESSVLPLVANDGQLAAAAALVSAASSLGTAFGTALLAPVLVRAFGVTPVIYTAGVLLLLAASRVFDLPAAEAEPAAPQMRIGLLRRRGRRSSGWPGSPRWRPWSWLLYWPAQPRS